MKRFFKIWGQLMADAKSYDEKTTGYRSTGFQGLAPFLALTLGWVPALYLSIFTKEVEEE